MNKHTMDLRGFGIVPITINGNTITGQIGERHFAFAVDSEDIFLENIHEYEGNMLRELRSSNG